MKKVSMQDIALELGLSKMTVSKCFKGSEDIAEDTKQTILLKAEEMGYVYRKRAKVSIAVLLSEVYFAPNEKFYSDLYLCLQNLGRENGIRFSLIYVSREDEKLEEAPSVEGFDGIMFLGQFSRQYILRISKIGLPLLCLDFGYRGIEADSVVSDSFRVSYDLTSYLIGLGHRKIGFVGNLNYTNSVNDRYLGYYKALLEENIELDPKLRVDDRDEKGMLSQIPLPEKMPTAFVCNNDHTAFLLIQQLKRLDIRVPQDVSVVGFDDILYAEISDPPITSAHVKRDFMAEQAITLMKRRLENPKAEYYTVTVDCSIKYRASASTPASVPILLPAQKTLCAESFR